MNVDVEAEEVEPSSRPLEADDIDRSIVIPLPLPPPECDECRYGPKSGSDGDSDESGSSRGDSALGSSSGDECIAVSVARVAADCGVAHSSTRTLAIGCTVQQGGEEVEGMRRRMRLMSER